MTTHRFSYLKDKLIHPVANATVLMDPPTTYSTLNRSLGLLHIILTVQAGMFLLSSHDEQIKLKSTFYSPKTRTLRGLKGAQTANEQKALQNHRVV